MGIRVHKQIGYGVTDIKTEGHRIVDSRIVDSAKFFDLHNQAHELTASDFVKWVYEHKGEIQHLRRRELPHLSEEQWEQQKKRPPIFFDEIEKGLNGILGYHLTYGAEFMLPNVMLFQPFGCYDSWSRGDDTIDYYEETSRARDDSERHTNWVKVLKDCSGIFPFDQGWIRYRPASAGLPPVSSELVNMKKMDAFGYRRWHPAGYKAHQVHVADLEDVEKNWRPILPNELLAVLLWFQPVFTDLPAFIDELRPMIYCHWG